MGKLEKKLFPLFIIATLLGVFVLISTQSHKIPPTVFGIQDYLNDNNYDAVPDIVDDMKQLGESKTWVANVEWDYQSEFDEEETTSYRLAVFEKAWNGKLGCVSGCTQPPGKSLRDVEYEVIETNKGNFLAAVGRNPDEKIGTLAYSLGEDEYTLYEEDVSYKVNFFVVQKIPNSRKEQTLTQLLFNPYGEIIEN